ncbi:MAG: GAF domain-containing protein [Acidobacteria bacterium]|nr:GAF domain-containing protein [Acidobacteriota bacterium]
MTDKRYGTGPGVSNEAKLRAMARQQKVVRELGARALSGIDPGILMEDAVAMLSRVLDMEYAKVLEVQPEEDTFLLRAGVGWKDGLVGTATVAVAADTQAGYALLSKSPVTVEDLRAQGRFPGSTLLHQHGVTSGASVPISGRERPFGVLGVHSRRRRLFDEEELDFLQTVAQVLAAAVERSHLEKRIRALRGELERGVREIKVVNEELASFTYAVAHDLREPLRHIAGFSKILAEEAGAALDPAALGYLQRIRQGAQRMGGMVEELLNLSSATQREPHKRMQGLSPLVAEVLESLRPEMEGRPIEWRVDELPAVECDSLLMKQVFAVLLSNAVKYTRPRQPALIHVGQADQGGQPVVFVRDNGVGFSMKCAGKLFGLFQRLHRREDFEGTGVGLATVQRIVRKHGGRVWAEAEPDQGATFYIALPAPDDGSRFAPRGTHE